MCVFFKVVLVWRKKNLCKIRYLFAEVHGFNICDSCCIKKEWHHHCWPPSTISGINSLRKHRKKGIKGQARCPLMFHYCKMKWIAAIAAQSSMAIHWLSPYRLSTGERGKTPWRIQLRTWRRDPLWWRWWVWKVKRLHWRCNVLEDVENWVEICGVKHVDLTWFDLIWLDFTWFDTI